MNKIVLDNHIEKERNKFLKSLAEFIWQDRDKIVQANKKDLNLANINNLENSFIDRLILDEKGIADIILRLKQLEKLKSHIGDIIEEKKVKQNLIIRKIRTSIGKILVIYESRPEVTIDAAAL